MTIIKINERVEINGCNDCPFLILEEIYDDNDGPYDYKISSHCRFDCTKTVHKAMSLSNKPNNCPIISCEWVQ